MKKLAEKPELPSLDQDTLDDLWDVYLDDEIDGLLRDLGEADGTRPGFQGFPAPSGLQARVAPQDGSGTEAPVEDEWRGLSSVPGGPSPCGENPDPYQPGDRRAGNPARKRNAASRIQRLRQGGAGKIIVRVVRALVVLSAVIVILSTAWFPVYQVLGSNMAPTLRDGMDVLVIRETTFERGDVIAFNYYQKTLVKRVIALGGDVVNIENDGTVTVNGEILNEPYVTQKSLGQCNITLPYTVPPEHLFVMGDDRAASIDSRTSLVGTVGLEQVYGKVSLKLWPLTSFGALS